MNDKLYAEALAPFLEEVRRLRPDGAEVIDAHTHLGLDEDGRSLTLEQLLSQLDDAEARSARACSRCTIPSASPPTGSRTTACSAWAGESDGRLVAFCRLDPAEDAARRGRTLPGGGRRRHQAASARPGLRVRRPGDGGDLHARRRRRRPDPDPRRARAAAAGRGPGEPRAAPPRGRADPRPRRDLRPGHPDLAPGRPPGGAVRHLLLLSARRDRAVRAGPRRAHRVRLRPPLRTAGDDAVHGAAGRPPGGARRAGDAGLLGETMAGLLDGASCPRHSRSRRGSTITLSGRLARVYGYASLVGPALFTGAIEQARAMLDMAIAACRDPEPADVGEALDTIGAALRRPTRCSTRRTACARRSTSSTGRSCAPPPRSPR